MDKVFIVTSGCYSDYMIEAVFSTHENAEEYIDSKQYPSEFRIEEYRIDDEIIREEKIFVVGIDLLTRETTMNLPFKVYNEMGNAEHINCFSFYEVEKQSIQRTNNSSFICVFTIKSKSAKVANKSAQDRLAQIIALEDMCYPLMRTKCVINVNNKSYRFPMYNIHTRELVLRPGEVEIKNYKY